MAGTPNGTLETLGRRIRSYRHLAGLTQRGLAQLARLDAKYFGEIERGRKNIRLDTLERIAAVLEVQPYQLLVPLAEGALAPGTMPAELDRFVALLERATSGQKDAVLKVLESFKPYNQRPRTEGAGEPPA